MNSFKVHFYGRTAHSADDPENGISALDGVELMSNGVNFMREHIIEKARVHYVTEVGGGQPNVVPAYARVWYYTRAPEREQVDYIYNWVLQIADGADKMARTTHKIEFLIGCYNVLPNKPLSDLIVANMREIGAPTHDDEEIKFAKEINKSINPMQKKEGLRKSKRPGWEKLLDELFDERILDVYQAGEVGAGSTDVADVSWVTPTKEFSTACCMLGTPGHSWQFTAQSGISIGHKGYLFATKTMAGTAIDLLTQPKLLRNVKAEFKARLQGRKYTVRTRAVRDGDRWIVSGQKVWTSGGHLADFGILLARTDPDVPKHQGLTFFVIDMRQPGVTVRPIRQINGQSEFTEPFFDGAEIPDANRLDEDGNGWAVAMTVLADERTTTSGISEADGRVKPELRISTLDDLTETLNRMT